MATLVDLSISRGRVCCWDNFYAFAANFNFNFDPSYADQDHAGTAFSIDLAGDLVMTHASLLDAQNIGAGKGG